MTDVLHPKNPFREALASRAAPEPCTLVIFGATGDLTHRKLIPALLNLSADGNLPPGLTVVGFARRPKTDEEFRGELRAAAEKFSRQAFDPRLWDSFAAAVFYHRSEFEDAAGYEALRRRIEEMEARQGAPGNRLFYLAAAPEQFAPILAHLKGAGLCRSPRGGWSRVIVEKPFGRDLATARALNQAVEEAFPERETYRIDHYLGKETAQNIMVLRFANAIFEPLWNNRYIDHVQITAAETLGVGSRGGYYDTSGALRDMVQNHLLQLLCLTAMEPPVDLLADSVRDEKVKVIRALRPIEGEDVSRQVVRGQYASGAIDGQETPGYLDEERVAPGSRTETFVALRAHVDNWRWAGVPFYIRVGKRLPKSATEIALRFRSAPPVLFNRYETSGDDNVLVIRIQPDEGISLRMQAKLPGTALRIEPVKMDFRYGTSFGKAGPEAYERLLLDAMSGDATLFARRDEVEHAWEFIDRIEEAWAGPQAPPLHLYPAGSWGPDAADELIAATGHAWRRL